MPPVTDLEPAGLPTPPRAIGAPAAPLIRLSRKQLPSRVLRRPTITDAVGRVVPLIHHETLLPGITDPAHRDRLARVGRMEVRLTARDYLPCLILLPLLIAVAFVPVATVYWFKLPGYTSILIGCAAGLLMPMSLVYVMRRTASRHLAAMYLEARICPSCGYDLNALVPAANDLRTCPECGGVWKVPTK